MSLERFHDAQADADSGLKAALAEEGVRAENANIGFGNFPPVAGLGRSGSHSILWCPGPEEACEYLRDPVLRARYDEMAAAVAEQLEAGVPVERLMGGSIDALKLASSATLFSAAASRLADEPSPAAVMQFCG